MESWSLALSPSMLPGCCYFRGKTISQIYSRSPPYRAAEMGIKSTPGRTQQPPGDPPLPQGANHCLLQEFTPGETEMRGEVLMPGR